MSVPVNGYAYLAENLPPYSNSMPAISNTVYRIPFNDMNWDGTIDTDPLTAEELLDIEKSISDSSSGNSTIIPAGTSKEMLIKCLDLL